MDSSSLKHEHQKQWGLPIGAELSMKMNIEYVKSTFHSVQNVPLKSLITWCWLLNYCTILLERGGAKHCCAAQSWGCREHRWDQRWRRVSRARGHGAVSATNVMLNQTTSQTTNQPTKEPTKQTTTRQILERSSKILLKWPLFCCPSLTIYCNEFIIPTTNLNLLFGHFKLIV